MYSTRVLGLSSLYSSACTDSFRALKKSDMSMSWSYSNLEASCENLTLSSNADWVCFSDLIFLSVWPFSLMVLKACCSAFSKAG
jgi:hypothetical protein